MNPNPASVMRTTILIVVALLFVGAVLGVIRGQTMLEVIPFLQLGTSIWVYFDAKSIGVEKGQLQRLADMGPAGWFYACLLLWIVGFPLYLAKRGEYKTINQATQKQAEQQDLRKCPFCAEMIKREAEVCKHCGRESTEQGTPPRREFAGLAR